MVKLAGTPAGRAFLQKNLPTFAKGLLKRTAGLPKKPLDIIRQRQLAEARIKPTPKPLPKIDIKGFEKKFPPNIRPIVEETLRTRPEAIELAKRGKIPFPQQRAMAEQIKPSIDIDALKAGDILNAETRRATALKIVDNAKAALAGKYPKKKVMDEIVKLRGLHGEAGNGDG